MKRSMLSATLLAVFVCTLAWGQSSSITGIVTDPSGGVVPGARLTLTNTVTGLEQSAITTDKGYYTFPLLQIGTYKLAVQAAGFKSMQRPDVVLAVADVVRLDFQLEIGEVSQEVNVQAAAPILDTETASLGSLTDERAVQELPVNGRNYVRFAQLAAGANESGPNAMNGGRRPDDRRRTSALAVNGQQDFQNNFLLDGVDNNERSIGSSVVRPAMDAIAEVKVLTNLYSADVGRTGGGVVSVVTKSGGNQFHGSLYEFLRNSALDAKNFFDPAGPTPPFRQNQFGGSLGGPIARGRTFFFGDYEGLRIHQSETFVGTVPTDAMKRGDFSGVAAIYDPTTRTRFSNDRITPGRIDPIGQRIVNLYPSPNIPGAGLSNNFVFNPLKTQRDDTFDTRVDHRLTDRDNFFVRYSFNDTNTYTPPQLPRVGDIEPGGDNFTFAGSALQRAQGLQLNETHTFGANLVGEFKAAFVRYSLASLPPNYGKDVSTQIGIPGANVDTPTSGLVTMEISGYRGLGDSEWIPLIVTNNLFQEVANLSYTRSNHNIKFGGDVRRRQVALFQSASPRGKYRFNRNFTSGSIADSGDSIASILLGYPASTERIHQVVSPGYGTTEFSTYWQDDWHVKPWFTLNLGVRYELATPFTEVANRASTLDLDAGKVVIAGQNGVSRSAGVQTDKNDWAPRFGFAATLSPRTVLRGGYGIFYHPPVDGSDLMYRNPPFVSLYSVTPSTFQPINRLADGFPRPVPADPNNPSGPVTTVAHDLQSEYVQQYNLTLQREIASGLVLSTGYVASLGRKQLYSPNINLAPPNTAVDIEPLRPYHSKFPNISDITYPASWGNVNYHSLQVTAEQRFRSGLTLSSNYTWSHAISDYQGIGFSTPFRGDSPGVVTNRRLERGTMELDVRQRFVFMWNYSLPFGQNLSGVARSVAEGWQVNGIVTMQGGLPFSVISYSPQSNTGTWADRPDRICDGKLSTDERTIGRYFDTSCFKPQRPGTMGTSGRNILTAPGLKNLDLSLFKTFTLAEDKQLQFRTEFFNLTNTPNFGFPDSAVDSPGFGQISDTSTSSRQIQFALKLLF